MKPSGHVLTTKHFATLPLMNTAFKLLQDARVFTKLDLRNAFHLVRIREGNEWNTAFNTPTGHAVRVNQRAGCLPGPRQ